MQLNIFQNFLCVNFGLHLVRNRQVRSSGGVAPRMENLSQCHSLYHKSGVDLPGAEAAPSRREVGG